MKNIKQNYLLITVITYLIINLNNLQVSGKLYEITIYLLMALNLSKILEYKEETKYKTITLLLYIIFIFFSKNELMLLFGLTNIIFLIIVDFKAHKTISIISLIIMIVFSPIILAVYILLTAKSNINNLGFIYKDTHYYCDNNYEIYMYSASAMDNYHYYIGKHYEILNIDDTLNITYKNQLGHTQEKYNKIYENKKCKLAGK